jgi:serine/threonine-protein kinase
MTDGQISSDSDWTGRTIGGRWEVVELVARGGMASIYRGRDTRLSRDVALKVPRESLLAVPGLRERFQGEIESLTKLSHPSIIQVIDVGEEQGLPYLVLQWLSGDDLAARLAADGPVAPAQLAEWVPQIAAALDYVHEQGFMHRDVKPGNILFGDTGNVVLTDMGIVKALGDKPSEFSSAGGTPGSPDYMGPEVAKTKTLTPAYDQYALALTAYEALGGKIPWRGMSEVKALVAKLEAPLPPLSDSVPKGVRDAIARATSREPESRFSTCSSFARSLVAGIEADAGAAAASSAGPKPSLSGAGPVGESAQTRIYSGQITSGGVAAAKAAAEQKPEAKRAPARKGGGETRMFRPEDVKKKKNPLLWVGLLVVGAVIAFGVIGNMGKKKKTGPVLPKPSVKLNSPQPDSRTRDADVLVRGTASEHVNRITVNDEEITLTAMGTFKHTLTLPSDGEHSIKVTVEDAAGQKAETFAKVTLDRSAPGIVLDDPATDVLRTAKAQLRVLGHLDDKDGLTRTRWGLFKNTDPTPYEIKTPVAMDAETLEFEIQATLTDEGEYILVVQSGDFAGNASEKRMRVILDQTAPKIAITSPEAGTQVRTPGGVFEVICTCDDPDATLRVGDVELKRGEDGTFSGSVGVPAGTKEYKQFDLLVSARDAAGNESSTQVTLERGADLVVDEPTDNDSTNQSAVMVRGFVSDTQSEVTVNDRRVEPNDEGYFEIEIALETEERHRILVKSIDSTGQKREYPVHITRDVSKPTLEVTSPKHWSEAEHEPQGTVDGNRFELEGTVDDVSDVSVYVNGEAAAVDGKRWRMVVYARWGLDAFEIKAVDDAGNESEPFRCMFRLRPPKFDGLRRVSDSDESRETLEYQLDKDPTLSFVLVPGGAFTMGAPDSDARALDNERPTRTVRVDRFLLTKAEVTWKQYLNYMDATGTSIDEGRRPSEEAYNHPVTGLTWEEASKYCEWAGGRLPREAEWEYAARAGVEENAFTWGRDWLTDKANVRGGPGRLVTVSTSGEPNGFGIYDVLGNAAEWCWDWYAADYYASTTGLQPNPRGPRDGTERVVRGGDFEGGPEEVRLSARRGVKPAPDLEAGETREYLERIGFRVAIPAPVSR